MEPATVKKEQEGEWVISGGEEIYTVYKENERLGIYKHHNEERLNALSKVVQSIIKKNTGDGVILFPAAMFYTNEKPASTFYNQVQETLIPVLKQTSNHIIVCTGVDSARDQIALALDRTGIIAKGRKFYASPGEDQIELAPDSSSEEDGKSRIFELNGTRYYLCVCYDIFGLRHKDLSNPGVDVVLNLVHCFYQPGEGPSGLALFAKHGLAGASKQWGCFVFGTAVFFNREIPPLWPTGVYWNQGDKSTTKWRYSDNPIKPADSFESITIEEGAAMGIMNTMLMAVMERTHEIGIMKAIGAKNRNILSLFLLEVGVVSLLGGIAGCVLGWVAAHVLSFGIQSSFDVDITAVVKPEVILGGLAVALIVGIVSGLYPARKASKMSPVEAIKYT
jgi:hypothetical protein